MNIKPILPTFGDVYKSARVIKPNLDGDPVQYFKLQKNKGISYLNGNSSNFTVEIRGLSGNSWVSSELTHTNFVGENVFITIPIPVYGITFNSISEFNFILELN